MRLQRKHMTGLLLLLLLLGAPSVGRENVEAAQQLAGRMVVQLEDLGTPMSGVEFQVYEAGSLTSQGTWELSEALKGKGVDLEGLESASQWGAAASKLAYLAKRDRLQGISGMTDNTGQMALENLKEGMYLVVQNGGKAYGEISPFLASIPFEENGEWKNEVTIYPKASFTPEEEKARITVTKRAGYFDQELLENVDLIHMDTTYYVGIFLDDQGKIPYGADYIRPIHMKGISNGKANFDGLPKKTYYVFETDINGNAIPVGKKQEDNGITWVCQLEKNSRQEINLDVNRDCPEGSVGFYNLYYDLPDGLLYKGSLDITKRVLRGNKQITIGDTFYAGIFRDKEASDLVTVEELKQNGTIRIEVPLGGVHGNEPVTYYVYETDKNGIPVKGETFGYLVNGEGKAELCKGSLESGITIINMEKIAMPTPTITPAKFITPTPAVPGNSTPTSGGGSSPSKGDSPKTGDDTPVMGYMVMLLATGILAVVLTKRQKTES